MSSLSVRHIEIHIPLAATEELFLQFAVQAAARKFRAVQADMTAPPQILRTDVGSIRPLIGDEHSSQD